MLENLILEGNPLGDDGALALADALPRLKAINVLDVCCCEISDFGARALATLASRAGLGKLALRYNPVTDLGAFAIAAVLPLCPHLNGLAMGAPEPDVDFNGEIADTDISDDGMLALAAAMKDHGSLKDVRMSYVNVTDIGIEALAIALSQCCKLEFLELRDIGISKRGFKALAAAIPRCPLLDQIVLHDIDMDDVDAIELAAMLPLCPALRHVDLGFNCFTNVGVLALCAAIRHCAVLKAFSLGALARADMQNAVDVALGGSREPELWRFPWRGGTCFKPLLPQHCRPGGSRLVCTHAGDCPKAPNDEETEDVAPQKRVKQL